MAPRRLTALALLVRCTHGLLLPSAPLRVPLRRGPARCRRAEATALRAAPQKYDDTTAPLAATLRSSEFAAAAATAAAIFQALPKSSIATTRAMQLFLFHL